MPVAYVTLSTHAMDNLKTGTAGRAFGSKVHALNYPHCERGRRPSHFIEKSTAAHGSSSAPGTPLAFAHSSQTAWCKQLQGPLCNLHNLHGLWHASE